MNDINAKKENFYAIKLKNNRIIWIDRGKILMPDRKIINSMKRRSQEIYHPDKDVFVPVPPFPLNMLVEVTNACNHACIFCANSKMTRKKRSIERKLLQSVLIQAYDLGTREIGFYATGEPLLYKDLDWAVNEAKRIGYKYIYLTTNGAFAEVEKIKTLVAVGLDSIKFSINGASRTCYKAVHGRDDFDKVLENLRQIKKYRDKEKVPLRIYSTFIITETNRHEVDVAKEVIGARCDELLFFSEGNQGGYMSQRNKPATITLPCSLLFNRFHVTCEGYYTMCCVDFQNYLAVADLNKVLVKDAWGSNLAVAMRKKHLASEVSGTLCENCVECKSNLVKPLLSHLATTCTF